MNETTKKNKTKIKRAIRKARKEANGKRVNPLLVAYETLRAVELVLDPFRLMKEAEDYWNYRPCCEDVLEFIDAIITNGEDINLKSEEGYGLLHIFPYPEAAEKVVALGGDINLPLKIFDYYDCTQIQHTRTPLLSYVINESDNRYRLFYKDVKTYLRLGADPNKAFLIPALARRYVRSEEREEFLETVEFAISCGADINQPDPLGFRALGYVEDRFALPFLLEHGADPNYFRPPMEPKFDRRSSPLTSAIYDKDTRRVLELLRGGADPNLCGEGKMNYGTPLFALLYGRHFKSTDFAYQESDLIIRLMAQYGTDINAEDYLGRTLFNHLESEYKFSLPVRTLIELGADIHHVSPISGDTVLHSVVESGYNLLWGEGKFWVDNVNALLEAGLDVNARNNDGKTPFRSLCDVYNRGFNSYNFPGAECMDLMRSMVKTGADINAPDNDGAPAIKPLLKYPFLRPFVDELKEIADYRDTVRAADNVDIDLYER